MSEKDILKEQIEHTKEAVDFFSGPNKKEREKWVVTEFLVSQKLEFDPNEIKPIDDDAPDIVFRDAMVEIKEIMDKGRRRHQEFKDEHEKAKKATKLKELFTPYTPRDITLQEVVDHVEKAVSALLYAPDFKSKTDLLFYVNFSKTHILPDKKFTVKNINKLKEWRSVSFLKNGKIGYVIYASGSAPSFLKNLVLGAEAKPPQGTP